MRINFHTRFICAVAVCWAVLLVPAIGMTQEPDAGAKAISARKGYMQLIVWEAGPLFGMAKGKMAYDADLAKAKAANLAALVQYPVSGLFLPATSKAECPGKTRALAEIQAEMGKFEKAFEDMQTAVAALSGKVGKGQPELAAAVGDLGKSCGNCHKLFRAKDF